MIRPIAWELTCGLNGIPRCTSTLLLASLSQIPVVAEGLDWQIMRHDPRDIANTVAYCPNHRTRT